MLEITLENKCLRFSFLGGFLFSWRISKQNYPIPHHTTLTFPLGLHSATIVTELPSLMWKQSHPNRLLGQTLPQVALQSSWSCDQWSLLKNTRTSKQSPQVSTVLCYHLPFSCVATVPNNNGIWNKVIILLFHGNLLSPECSTVFPIYMLFSITSTVLSTVSSLILHRACP